MKFPENDLVVNTARAAGKDFDYNDALYAMTGDFSSVKDINDRMRAWEQAVPGLSTKYIPYTYSPLYAALTSSAILNRGTGSPTVVRATTAGVTDWENFYKTAKSGEIRFTGARRVENLCPTPSTTIAVSGNKTITVGIGTFVFSMGVEATGTSLITFTGTATGSTGTLTANATNRTSKTLTITVGGTIIATCTVAAANNIQFENVTGQSNQNPAEYTSVGVLSTPFQGAGVDGVQYFPYQNGNTVASNVVTEAQGAAIATTTLKGFLSEPLAQNLCLQSNAFTTTWVAGGTPTPTQNTVGITGAANEAWTLTDNDAGTLAAILRVDMSLTATNIYTASVFVGKTVGAQSNFPSLSYNNSTATHCAGVNIDTTNGVVNTWTSFTGRTIVTSSSTISSFNANFWRVTLTFTAQTTESSPNVPTLTPARRTSLDGIGDGNVAAQGSAVFQGAQVELGSFATSYIPTTTVAVTRNGDVESYPTASNIVAAQGTIYLEYTPRHAPVGTIALWGTYVDASNYTAILHDGTNLIFRKRIAAVNYDATIANTFVSGTTYKMAATWGAAGSTIALNGTMGTPHANTTAAQIAATMQWGTDGNSLQQPTIQERNGRIWQTQLSDVILKGLTT